MPAAGVPQPLHQRRGQRARPAARWAAASCAELRRDRGEGVLGGDEQGVERRGPRRRTGAAASRVGVAVRRGSRRRAARTARSPGRWAGRPAAPWSRSARRKEPAAAGLDAGQRAVPAGAVVHARLPGVHDGGQSAAAQVAAVGEVAVPGGQPRIASGRRKPRRAETVRVRPVHQPARRARAPAAGRCRRSRAPRGAPAARPSADERQKSGPGKYASSGTAGLKTMCGTRPSAHCAPSRVSSSRCARRGGQMAQPDRDERRVPAPLVRVQACARARWRSPVQLPSSTRRARRAAGARSSRGRGAGRSPACRRRRAEPLRRGRRHAAALRRKAGTERDGLDRVAGQPALERRGSPS